MVERVTHPLKPVSLLLHSHHNIPTCKTTLTSFSQYTMSVPDDISVGSHILSALQVRFCAAGAVLFFALFCTGVALSTRISWWRRPKSCKQEATASIKTHLKPPIAARFGPTPPCLNRRLLAVPILPLSSLHHPHTRPGRSQISIGALGSGSPVASDLALRRRPTRVHSGVKASSAAQVHTERVFRLHFTGINSQTASSVPTRTRGPSSNAPQWLTRQILFHGWALASSSALCTPST
ncbi:hypothetical protein K438DRAFT_475019 [Mycena galopus ATCC 62051]|nr:hypothetical protein K438DRAFT_475019 [Mycena galopus ATCC 62051]